MMKAGGTEIGKTLAEKSRGLFSANDWQCKTYGQLRTAERPLGAAQHVCSAMPSVLSVDLVVLVREEPSKLTAVPLVLFCCEDFIHFSVLDSSH